MDYVLQHELTKEDLDFLNVTTLEFKVFNTHGLKVETQFDSGWCDAATGSQIIGKYDRVAFLNVTPEDLTLLSLRFYNRLQPLNNGLKKDI